MWVAALVAALLLGVPPLASWNQHPHRQVNFEATKVFFAGAAAAQKFQLGPISEVGRNALHRGIAVTSSTLFVKPVGGLAKSYQLGEERHSMAAWISLGGDWADEPHLYASVRHFYDPLEVNGVAYLSDQYWVHGNYDSPAIDAVTWALEHPDNPFCLKAGMVAYKLAMETPEDRLPATALAATHFKTNLNLIAKDAAEQRSLYLAKAYRALGEAMHMIGDMTQPAHVRNDSHPIDEPIEGSIYSSHVRQAAAHPLVDSRVQSFLASAGGSLQTPRGLSHQLALFTNRNFYSMDTIFDQPSGTMPNNKMPSYPLPQFSSLTPHTATIRGFAGKRKVKRLFAKIAGREVPVAQERLSFHWFDPDRSLIPGSVEEAKVTAGRAVSNLGPYMIPSAFAREQAAVLLPIAIHACADLMDLFFPTLELEAKYRDEGLQAGTAGSQRQVITIEPTMVHHRKRDPAWEAFDLAIEYSGPGAMVITRAGKVEATRKLQYEEGLLAKIESSAGPMIAAPLQVFVAAGDSSLSEEEAFYAFEHGQKLHLEIDAGSRHFESPTYELKPEVVITPRIAIGPPGATFDFDAYAQPEGIYRFEWTWPGMEGPVTSEGSTSTVAPILTEEGEYAFTVKLIHADGTVLAEDRVTAYVEEEEENEKIILVDDEKTEADNSNSKTGRWVLYDTKTIKGCDFFSNKYHIIDVCVCNEGHYELSKRTIRKKEDSHSSVSGTYTIPPKSMTPGDKHRFKVTSKLKDSQGWLWVTVYFYSTSEGFSIDERGNISFANEWSEGIVQTSHSRIPSEGEFIVPENLDKEGIILISAGGTMGAFEYSAKNYYLYKWQE